MGERILGAYECGPLHFESGSGVRNSRNAFGYSAWLCSTFWHFCRSSFGLSRVVPRFLTDLYKINEVVNICIVFSDLSTNLDDNVLGNLKLSPFVNVTKNYVSITF